MDTYNNCRGKNMNIHALIIEQLEWDGHLKSFTLQAQRDLGQMWVAFPDEYQNDRKGPFHFLDSDYENIFEEKNAKCREAKLPPNKFFEEKGNYCFSTTWNQIPTERNELTYYSLYLPEYAVPDEINITDTYQHDLLFKKMIYRDDKKKRYIVYLECRSRAGRFNFKLNTKFHKDEKNFKNTRYSDDQTIDFYERGIDEHWYYILSDNEREKVSNFFAEQIIINHGKIKQSYKPTIIAKKNNPWISGSFYLFVVVVILTIFAIIYKTVQWFVLPIVIIGGAVLVGIIGAFQLRNDDKLREENFIKLMTETYKLFPLLKRDEAKKY